MKISILRKFSLILISGVMSVLVSRAQVADWNFNNVLTGTGSANSTAGNASLGSTIAGGGAFNGGTVYYGEGTWPAGSIDLNAYLEFSITPTAGHTLTVSSLVMQIRRSTTGTSGAGPNTWSLTQQPGWIHNRYFKRCTNYQQYPGNSCNSWSTVYEYVIKNNFSFIWI